MPWVFSMTLPTNQRPIIAEQEAQKIEVREQRRDGLPELAREEPQVQREVRLDERPRDSRTRT